MPWGNHDVDMRTLAAVASVPAVATISAIIVVAPRRSIAAGWRGIAFGHIAVAVAITVAVAAGL